MFSLQCSVNCFIIFVLGASFGLEIVELGGEWLLEDSDGSYKDIKAKVPGGIYSDLMDNKVIGDIHYGYNDTETRWVALKNWTYHRRFTVDNELLAYSSINLIFEGLDTFSTIFINDMEIGKSDNMFVRYIFEVKKFLKPGENSIAVNFSSPVKIAANFAQERGYLIPPNCPSSEYRGECHVNQIRKMQASFSWDWGPAFPSMGIWKNVYLEGFNMAAIRYITTSIKDSPQDDSWLLNVTTYLDPGQNKNITGKITCEVQTDVAKIVQVTDVSSNVNNNNEIQIVTIIKLPKLQVKRWWPNGYGAQPLYELLTFFESPNSEVIKYQPIKIAFRTIQLIQDSVPSGLTFYFKVNDIPIFAKGSNEIPLDILPELGQSPQVVSKILESPHATNMNMLRVWGGGVYESEEFYTKCDELGILIWQDFMFACAMYPADDDFLENVRREVRHQARRLNNHASIAIWAGNNENEIALVGNWYGIKHNESLYRENYRKLYISTIRDELYKTLGEDNVIYVTSSPSNGRESENENYLANNPGDQHYGDVHFYNYLANSLSPAIYPIPRFVSEFGYQSLPSVDSWLKVTDNLTDLLPNSKFMAHRQHHPGGLIQNDLMIEYQIELDNTRPNYYKAYIFYLQIVQAMSIKTEVELYRSFMGRYEDEVDWRGNTMGALFWQLNDVWVAPTWSGIDYTGKWKMLQYYALKFFAPTIICAYLNVERQLKIYVVSEVVSLIDSALDVIIIVDIYNWNSFKAINSMQMNATIQYGISHEVASLDVDNVLKNSNCGSLSNAKNNCFFYLTLKRGDSVIAPKNFALAAALKESSILKAEVKIAKITQIDKDGKKFEIVVSATQIAIFVWLDSHQIDGRFSENGFLQVEPEKSVNFESVLSIPVEYLEESLTVTHLKDPLYD